MSYRDTFLSENAKYEFTPSLHEHMSSRPLEDVSVKYELPYIKRDHPIYTTKTAKKLDYRSIRLPARINSPLIPYPEGLRQFAKDGIDRIPGMYHASHTYQLSTLRTMRNRLITIHPEFLYDLHFDVPSLKQIVKNNYSSRSKLIHLSAFEFARKATCAELSICAMEKVNYQAASSPSSNYLSFLISIQRMRVLLANHDKPKGLLEIPVHSEETDAILNIYEDGTYTYIRTGTEEGFALLVAGNHFMLTHMRAKKWFVGNFTYLDYALTTADTVNNLEILAREKSYEWAGDFFRIIIQLAEDAANHNHIVNFMKSFEGFMLNLSDYDEKSAMNWSPILEILHELWVLDQLIINIRYEFSLTVALLHDPRIKSNPKSNLCNIIKACSKMTKTQIQELSSLHKFVFYAEVDADAGVKKFLKRVHTERPIDLQAQKNIVRLAKLKFLLSYAKKHKCIPTLRGSDQKALLIRLHHSRNEMSKLEEYPLTWWDDICIWNCMDNTLTDDALEFSKDKGALKSAIRHGPGDSRKELLQVIEQENYMLKPLIPPGGFEKLPMRVYETTSSEEPITYNYPVRLIEKEREQKIEARLFANAELSNKHGLSVIATQMKKALNYFDEQLMTPSDSTRKMMLHKNAQLLLEKDNYSILMDIEGHNQSMQFLNTADLCEFLGNLYGNPDWRSIPNYFGACHVYHYDEYVDRVIVSEGQLGGIEGWLNPLWTLHTTLMMQLLRYMTDVDVRSIMVYSDDVNNIANIPQCTEMTIQATFSKIMEHCMKFGMVAKMSQTNLSKHRATMLRQHYYKGIKSDSTLKRLMSVSGVNNPMVMSEELEVAGICSSASSALENSNHSHACCFLKNYKLGILLARYPHMLLNRPRTSGMLSPTALPTNLADLLYNIKDRSSLLSPENKKDIHESIINDVSRYLVRNKKDVKGSMAILGLSGVFELSISDERLIDHADRMLYLQVYDQFLSDLLFFLIYLPCSVGGLGGILHINMTLSGHSVGMSKSLHYLHRWISDYACNNKYFFKFLENSLSRKETANPLKQSSAVITNNWPSEKILTTCSSSLSSAIKAMVKSRTKNRNVLRLIKLSEESEVFTDKLLEIFQHNFHERIVQFYYENSSVHFFDLLINKIETSSGLLSFVKDLGKLRRSLVGRAIRNARIASECREITYGSINEETDIISYLLNRRSTDYPEVNFIDVAEVLYDSLLQTCNAADALITVRKSSPQFFKNGIQMYNDPRFGDEVLYKGEFLDNERLLGNKEELIAAKVCSVTKWLLSKHSLLSESAEQLSTIDCIQAANLCLQTLTGQSFMALMKYCPDETGGEILHRIPNMRFSTKAYIRSELNDSLRYTAEISQRIANDDMLMDSNINFEYVRMRLILAAMTCNAFDLNKSLIMRYNFKRFTGIVDVQFVKPLSTDKIPPMKIEPYSQFRSHVFSEFRFRFMATTYLHSENVNDMSLIPNQKIYEDYSLHGRSLMRDITYKYAMSLDKEYMLSNFKYPPNDTWEPIYKRLEQIDVTMKDMSCSEKQAISIELLEESLNDRGNFYITKRRDKVESELQTACLESLKEQSPWLQTHEVLLDRYSFITNKNITDHLTTDRMTELKSAIQNEVKYRRKLAIYTASEAVITMHFMTTISNQIVKFDARSSIRQLRNTGVLLALIMEVNPILYAKIQLIGPPAISEILNSHSDEVLELLIDISMSTQFIDTSIPTIHLSTPVSRPLKSEFNPPEAAQLVEYSSFTLSDTAMESLHDLRPILNFADRACKYAASPYTWESPTGSDSYCSQYAIMKLLQSKFGIDKSVNICDLTAGRGDGRYAMNNLGLTCVSYSKPDEFTTLHHHPDIIFKNDYDVFSTDTLKFITEFDFIHIDISFVGNKHRDISDLILMLESLSTPYCLRLNSVSLDIYARRYRDLQIVFDHHLAYSSSNIYKTSDVFLIGLPSNGMKRLSEKSLKQTAAFRAMALSYSRLLGNPYHAQLLHRECRNSISETLPSIKEIPDMIMLTCDKAFVDERTYYLKRFTEQYGTDSTIYLGVKHIHPKLGDYIQKNFRNVEIITTPVYRSANEKDVGLVSPEIRRHHDLHLKELQQWNTQKYKITLNRADILFVTMLRQLHPLYSVRGLCNVLIGIAGVAPDVEEYTEEEIDRALSIRTELTRFRFTKHQTDTSTAIKLLVLASYQGDDKLGLKYCAILGTQKLRPPDDLIRIRLRYKQLSWIIPVIKEMIADGRISNGSITILIGELMTRKVNQSAQAKRNAYVQTKIPYLGDDKDMNEETLLQLFEMMELFATGNLLTTRTDEDEIFRSGNGIETQITELENMYEDVFGEMTSALNIGDLIDDAVNRLGLEVDPLTGRYKGFEETENYYDDDEI